MLFLLIPLFFSYPLELQEIDTYKNQTAYLVVNDSPYELALCYNEDLKDEEAWKPMIEYSAEGKYIEVDLPKEGDFDLFYTFRLTTKEYTSFCQPFRYTKKGYVVIDKNYTKQMSKKFTKKNKEKKDKKDKEEEGDVESSNETVLVHWFGLIFVVFVLLCLVAIFSSGGSGGL